MNNKIRVLVVDDESLAREAITLRLQNYSRFELCGEADNGNDAIILVRETQPDVIFLDIEMPEISGIEAAQVIVENSDALIVFISAYRHFAIQAFRVSAVDYILKPIDDGLFEAMLSKLEQRVEEKASLLNENVIKALTELLPGHSHSLECQPKQYLLRIAVKSYSETVMVNVSEIESIVSAKDYLCIKTADDNHIHRCTMKQMESLLDPKNFLRTHRSHIVNIAQITKVDLSETNKVVYTTSGEKHPISRRYIDKVKACIRHVALLGHH
jgi:two-component system LytT family response regulator